MLGRARRSRERRAPMPREERLRRIKKAENRMLGLAGAMCVAMAGAGWIYKRNNAIPNLVVPETPRPARNGYDFLISAAEQSVPAPRQPPVDTVLDYTGGGLHLKLGSPEYEWRYPLARQSKYLQSNARALKLLRQGLALPYVQAPDSGEYWIAPFRVSDLRDLLGVEAHERARRQDWDGAVQSLRDTFRLSYAIAHGAGVDALVYGASFRKTARAELDWLSPRLSAEQLRAFALQLEEMHRTRVQMPQALEEEKRLRQRFLLHLMRIGDLRILYGYNRIVLTSSGKPPAVPPLEQLVADSQRESDKLPRLLQLKLGWVSKPSVLREHARCFDWQIAQARLPYLLRTKQWPFPRYAPGQVTSDALHSATYPGFSYEVRNALKDDTLDTLTFVGLALRAFQLDHKYLPHRLSELVPRYLARVPSDPFDPRRELSYRPQSIRESWIERRQKFVQPPSPVVATAQGFATPTPFPGQSAPASPSGTPWPPSIVGQGPPPLLRTPVPLSGTPDPSGGPTAGPGPFFPTPTEAMYEEIVHPIGVPWTLWSIGPDGRDDNGLFFRKQGRIGSAQFKIESVEPDTRFDIVAGINR